MKQREEPTSTRRNTIPGRLSHRLVSDAVRATPIALAAFVRLALVRYWRVALVISGFVVQVVLTLLMWQLVDLSVSLMEVWAELARKHLEITLS